MKKSAQANPKTQLLPIKVAKEHLLTLGTKLYPESVDLIRELVANAYDADATKIFIDILPDSIVVQDNGSGMNKKGLLQFFTVGSTYKKEHSVSKKYKRLRIGEFGIGKFAVLAVCDRFEIYTKKGKFAASVIFDKTDWREGNMWKVPILRHTPASDEENGTKVTLSRLTKQFDPSEVEAKIKEKIPLDAKKFEVFLNGTKLQPKYIVGQRFRVSEKTKYGLIRGEIILSNFPLQKEDRGIECKVKKVTIKREFFGLERAHGANRITGQINADFLPVTSSRDNFILDSDEYKEFYRKMEKVSEKVLKKIRKISSERETKKVSEALSEAMRRVRQALKSNPDFYPKSAFPLLKTGDLKKSGEVASTFGRDSKKVSGKEGKEKEPKRTEDKDARKKKARIETVKVTPKRIIKRLRIGGITVNCSLQHLGDQEVEAFSREGLIIINRDHPLFKKMIRKKDTSTLYLARLITQELSLQSNPKSPRKAFEWQSRLLTDAFEKRR